MNNVYTLLQARRGAAAGARAKVQTLFIDRP